VIELKAHDVVDKSFRMLQLAADSDPDSVIVWVDPESGNRFKAWDLTGCTVVAILRRNGDTGPIIPPCNVTDIVGGLVRVRFDTMFTGVGFEDGEQHRDASLEIEVARSDGTSETVPPGGYIPIRINRDLDGQ